MIEPAAASCAGHGVSSPRAPHRAAGGCAKTSPKRARSSGASAARLAATSGSSARSPRSTGRFAHAISPGAVSGTTLSPPPPSTRAAPQSPASQPRSGPTRYSITSGGVTEPRATVTLA